MTAPETMLPPEIATEGTGLGLRIAVIDSGVNFDHPHLGIRGTSFEVFWTDEGELESRRGPVRDSFGHGTCCAALIHYLAPGASLTSVKVTGERSTTDADRLRLGIEVAVENECDLICVPMATETRIRRGLDQAVAAASAKERVVIAADPGRDEALPANSPGAVGIRLFDGVDVAISEDKVCADGHARPFGAGPSNFYGPSLSAARAVAAYARFAEISNLRGESLSLGFKKLLRMI